MTELDLLIADYGFAAFLVVALLTVLVYLRSSSDGKALAEDSRQPSKDKSDLVAEADLYIAYGHYEQAAQAIRKALDSEHLSADLVVKLLEIHFASGDTEEFVAQSRYYEDRFGRSGQWEAIRTMGQKLIPEERLFR